MKLEIDFGMDNFNVIKEYSCILNFIQSQITTGLKTAIIGISGGKDSTIVAKLLVDALGKENVIGVIMPNDVQPDFLDAQMVCDLFEIKQHVIDISKIYNAFINDLTNIQSTLNNQVLNNIPPRIRMTILYAIAQSYPGGRVVGTGNMSENYIGWCTKWGDMACDFNPIAHLTCSQVVELGDYLNLPYELVHKIPSDGLTGKSDEENFGFTYKDLDSFLSIPGTILSPEVFGLISKRHLASLHKIGVRTLSNNSNI